ncbi:MAG: Arylsulfatase, partial [Verrucomicrobiota bacterium]
MRLLLLLLTSAALAADRPPNIVLILVDDLGYGDVGCFGAKDIRTPNIDALAKQGTRFTDFYVAQAVCTASRAALLTGCYPNRVGMQGALNHTSRFGLNPSEWTLPKMLKERGYATGCFGKWHLGTVPELSAPRQGFDEFLGLPYSNDNSKYHPSLASEMPPLPLLDGEKVAELDPDQSTFTARFTAKGVDFIERHKDRPFFLYLPHVMPHVPIFASAKFKGRSARGLYGDVVEELDDAIGTLLAKLRETGLEQNTIVLFFSDNGAWMSYGEHAGSNRPFREGKLTCFEGGVRTPLIVRWPGQVPAGRTCGTPFMSIDLLPTFVEAVGGKAPTLKIDGRSALPLLRGTDESAT